MKCKEKSEKDMATIEKTTASKRIDDLLQTLKIIANEINLELSHNPHDTALTIRQATFEEKLQKFVNDLPEMKPAPRTTMPAAIVASSPQGRPNVQNDKPSASSKIPLSSNVRHSPQKKRKTEDSVQNQNKSLKKTQNGDAKVPGKLDLPSASGDSKNSVPVSSFQALAFLVVEHLWEDEC